MMNQGEAVFQAVKRHAEVVPGTAVKLSDEQKKKVYEELIHGFMNGDIRYKLKDGEKLEESIIRKYVPGLVNNWVRKDKRLNGDVKYEAKNPGSRTGNGDEKLKNMKALLDVVKDPAAKKEIQQAIDDRKAELQPKKEINLSALPEHLRQYAPESLLEKQTKH